MGKTLTRSNGEMLAVAFLLIGIAIATVAVGTATLVFAAYGCGKLFARWLPFSLFEATVVSLLALAIALGAAAKMLSRFFDPLRSEPGETTPEAADDGDDEPGDSTVNDRLPASSGGPRNRRLRRRRTS